MNRPLRVQLGTSLLELSLVLTLMISVTAGIVVGLSTLNRQQQCRLVADQMTHVLQLARQFALLQQQRVWVCATSDQQHCGGQWQDGQLIVNQTQQSLAVFAAMPVRTRMRWRGGFAKGQLIGFQANGATLGQQGHFAWFNRLKLQWWPIVKVLTTGDVVELRCA